MACPGTLDRTVALPPTTMRFFLIALIGFLTLSAVFNFDPGPMPGIKIKNALLYAIHAWAVTAHDVSAFSHSAAGDVDAYGV